MVPHRRGSFEYPSPGSGGRFRWFWKDFPGSSGGYRLIPANGHLRIWPAAQPLATARVGSKIGRGEVAGPLCLWDPPTPSRV